MTPEYTKELGVFLKLLVSECSLPKKSRERHMDEVESLVAAAIRLAAIEAAGDEEVDAILGAAAADLDGERNSDVLDAAYKIGDIAKSALSRLRGAEERVRELEKRNPTGLPNPVEIVSR